MVLPQRSFSNLGGEPRNVITSQTIEDFWSITSHIELSKKLSSVSDYSLKAGVKLMCEDTEGIVKVAGGLINLDKKQLCF